MEAVEELLSAEQVMYQYLAESKHCAHSMTRLGSMLQEISEHVHSCLGVMTCVAG